MANHFKAALNDPEVMEKFKDKPFHKAVLHAFAAYKEKGYSIFELPWFEMTKTAKQKRNNKKAA